MHGSVNLKPTEIARAFDLEVLRQQYPPIQSPEQVGLMLGFARSTIYQWADQGRLDGTFRKRGKHIRFWRDRVLDKFFNGSEWEHNEQQPSE